MTRPPTIPFPILALLVAAWIGSAANLSFWRAVAHLHSLVTLHDVLAVAALGVIVVASFNLALQLLSPPWLGKPLLIALLLTSAVLAYFMGEYGTLIDKGMVRNAMETDPAEVRDLLSMKLAGYILVLGVLPAALIAFVRSGQRAWWHGIALRLILSAASLLIIVSLGFTFYQDYSAFFRNHREIAYLLNPANLLRAGIGIYHDKYSYRRPFQNIGVDAHRTFAAGMHAHPALTIIVVGETARAENFSLGGYARPTNPLLERAGVIYYPNVSSCGTATAVSVPCMFSNLGRKKFAVDLAATQNDLLDVLQIAGVGVLWRDNNSGCKGVCARVPSEDMSKLRVDGMCDTSGNAHACFDEVLLEGLQDTIDKLGRDTVLVLHQNGSHGPDYSRRYPSRFAVFQPECKTNQLAQCSREEIRAAYDNTILYTDYFLARIIALLQHNADVVDGAMIYLSDHGESLGENNLYLHGIPYLLAPEQQKHIPMVVWLSDNARQRYDLDAACLRDHRGAAYSHDNLFHSILGLMEVRTALYRPESDLFQPCRGRHLVSLPVTTKMPG